MQKVRVYSDSVQCLGKMNGQSQDGKVKWKNSKCPSLTKNCWESDGEAIEFESIIFGGYSSMQILQDIQNDLRERETLNLANSKTGNDIDKTKKGNDGICISNSEKVKDYAKRFLQRHGLSGSWRK